MKRFLATVAIVAYALTSSSAFAAGEKISIRKVDASAFPEVKVTISTPNDDPDAIEVEENGSTITDLAIDSFVEQGEVVDVVLAVDTSGSMEGDPLEAAVDAASSFVSAVPDNVRLGVVTFSDEAKVAQRVTSDRDAVQEAIDGLEATGETSLYDGVTQAVSLLSDTNQGNIVLLSDGSDTVSDDSLAQAISAAKKAKATIYSVGLQSEETDEAALQQMAQATGGTFAPAESADLTAVYADLAKTLKGQYFITYPSTVESGDEISLVVSDASGESTAIALAPEAVASETPAAAAQAVVPEDHLIDGNTGLIIVTVVTFIAVFALLYLWMVAGAKDRSDRELARRMGAGAATGSDEASATSGPVSWIPDQLVDLAGQIADRRGSGAALERRLERAGWRLKVGEFLAGVLVAGVAGLLLGVLLVQKPLFVILVGIVGAAIPLVLLSLRTSRRMAKLHAQLPDILAILASSLRAGHSFLQSLDAVGKEIGGPGGEEFGRLTAEIRLGKTVDVALADLADRVGSDDFKWAVLAVSIQREVGGNLAEVLDTVADTMRERDQIRRQVDVLSAEGRLSLYILAGLPIVIGLYLALINPSYFGLLFSTRIGLVMIITAAALEVLGVIWMKRVVKINV
jgi:tight adherence protein B